MSLVKLHVDPRVTPFQIEGFGSEVERSVEGSLYFRPNTIRSITLSEWIWIQKNEPTNAKFLRVLSNGLENKKLPFEKKAKVENDSTIEKPKAIRRGKRKRKKKTE